MFKGFKEFIMRGNVIGFAVAVVIGTAFTAIVNAAVEGTRAPEPLTRDRSLTGPRLVSR